MPFPLNQVLEKKHCTITAAMKVVNDIIVSFDKKQHCAVLLIDLSKSFDFVEHDILKLRLLHSDILEHTLPWFTNDL